MVYNRGKWVSRFASKAKHIVIIQNVDKSDKTVLLVM